LVQEPEIVVAEAAGVVTSPSATDQELPIAEVLRHLKSGDAEDVLPDPGEAADAAAIEPDPAGETETEAELETEALQPETVTPPPLDPLQRSLIADFMGDDHGRLVPDRGAPAGPEQAPGQTSVSSSSADLFSGLKASWSRYGGFRRKEGLGAIIPGRRTAEAPRTSLLWVVALVVVGLMLVSVLVLIVQTWGARTRPEGIAGRTPAASATPGQEAFVTASVLNCRSAPAMQAPPVDRLIRGDSVQLLARDEDWVSLSHDGGQCWALLRYMSLTRPL
jgi:hypothetical protein